MAGIVALNTYLHKKNSLLGSFPKPYRLPPSIKELYKSKTFYNCYQNKYEYLITFNKKGSKKHPSHGCRNRPIGV